MPIVNSYDLNRISIPFSRYSLTQASPAKKTSPACKTGHTANDVQLLPPSPLPRPHFPSCTKQTAQHGLDPDQISVANAPLRWPQNPHDAR